MWFLLAVAVFAFVPELHACTCSTPATPCSRAGLASAAFTGTAVDVSETPARRVPESAGGRNPVNRMPASRRSGASAPRFLPSFRTVRMRVGEVLSGVPAGLKEIEVVTGIGGGDCGYRFEPDVAYVVYAHRDADGRLATTICSGTRPFAQAAEDLDYFHVMAAAPATGELSVRTGVPGNPGRRGVWIGVERDGLRYTALTGAAGIATFTGLPPGEYTVHVESDGDQPDDPKTQVTAKGCRDVTLIPSQRIAGSGGATPPVRIGGETTERGW